MPRTKNMAAGRFRLSHFVPRRIFDTVENACLIDDSSSKLVASLSPSVLPDRIAGVMYHLGTSLLGEWGHDGENLVVEDSDSAESWEGSGDKGLEGSGDDLEGSVDDLEGLVDELEGLVVEGSGLESSGDDLGGSGDDLEDSGDDLEGSGDFADQDALSLHRLARSPSSEVFRCGESIMDRPEVPQTTVKGESDSDASQSTNKAEAEAICRQRTSSPWTPSQKPVHRGHGHPRQSRLRRPRSASPDVRSSRRRTESWCTASLQTSM